MSDKIIHLEDRRRSKETVRCPRCGTDDIAKIVYGYPSDELLHSKDENIRLGGCVVFDDSPDWECKQCGECF